MNRSVVLKEVDLSEVIITRIRDCGSVVTIFLEDPETGREFAVNMGKRHFEMLSEDEILYELWKIVQERKSKSSKPSDKIERLLQRYSRIRLKQNSLRTK